MTVIQVRGRLLRKPVVVTRVQSDGSVSFRVDDDHEDNAEFWVEIVVSPEKMVELVERSQQELRDKASSNSG